MNTQQVSRPSTDPGARDDLRGRLEMLQARVSALAPDSSLQRVMSGVREAVERLRIEHAGMAEELLSVYEQLGVVFEVTRKLPSVQSESEVIDLFVDSLCRSFGTRDVFAVYPHLLPDEPCEGTAAVEHWLGALIRQARRQGSARVARPPGGAMPGAVEEILVGPVFAGDSFVCAVVLTRSAEGTGFRASDMLLLDSLMMFCGDLIRNYRLVRELREMSIAMVRSLVNAVDQKDAYTSGHSLRVGYYATLLGETLGLGDIDLQMLQWSALLHDVGKIGIRDSVLKKEGKLTAEEFDHIKEHPIRSHNVVQEVPQLKRALAGVLHHHERYNGTGYPEGLAGEQIPLQARIIQIADVFDALTSNRSYRPAYDWKAALDILKEEAGKTVDPKLQAVFDRIVRGALDGDPDGWEKMLSRANSFAQITERAVHDLRE